MQARPSYYLSTHPTSPPPHTEQIQWCREHDAECRAIARNAQRLYDAYCAQEGILDYLQLVTHKASRCFFLGGGGERFFWVCIMLCWWWCYADPTTHTNLTQLPKQNRLRSAAWRCPRGGSPRRQPSRGRATPWGWSRTSTSSSRRRTRTSSTTRGTGAGAAGGGGVGMAVRAGGSGRVTAGDVRRSGRRRAGKL